MAGQFLGHSRICFRVLKVLWQAFRKARELLLASFSDGYISEDGFLLFYDANTFSHQNYGSFELERLHGTKCLSEFRFLKKDIPALVEVTRLADWYTCVQGIEGLCILWSRLAYPCGYSDLIHHFGRPVPEIYMIIKLYTAFTITV